MGSRRRPGSTRLGRLLRARCLDRNPLRRGSDRVETAVLGLLLAAFLAAAPFAAHAAESWAYATSAREQHAQQTALYRVPATLLQGALDPYATSDVTARWRAPDGRMYTGPVLVPLGTAAGTTVTVWVTRTGQQEGPPLLRSEVTGRAQLAAGLAVAALAIALAIIGWLARRALDKRRIARWDADWLATEPRWSPRQ
jgi:hypothetical protein